ncbi:hypothetical protein ACU635_61065 [[Actinomadura] parvosata]|uniref:hypothetical protein n=1 Tax=[Actinomadura] parvosata TaxID=1955412 RepID=UPI00406C1EB2
MLPEVKAYYDALDDRNHRIEADRVRAAHPVPDWDHTMSPDQVAAYFEAEDRQNTALRELERARKQTQADAYRELLASENPLVRFLVTDPEVQAYPRHAEIALKALPMTREEMEEFGERHDWCHEYGRLLERAEAAGVLPPPLPELADIEPLVSEIVRWSGLSERRLRAIVKKYLPDILASAEAKNTQPVHENPPATT